MEQGAGGPSTLNKWKQVKGGGVLKFVTSAGLGKGMGMERGSISCCNETRSHSMDRLIDTTVNIASHKLRLRMVKMAVMNSLCHIEREDICIYFKILLYLAVSVFIILSTD